MHVSEEVDLEDMTFFESDDDPSAESSTGGGYYVWNCRCSGSYVITEEQLEQGFDVVQCELCSLAIRVLYECDENFATEAS